MILSWVQAETATDKPLRLSQLIHMLHLLFHSGDVVYLVCISYILFNCWAKCGIPRTYSFRKSLLGHALCTQ